MGRKVLSAYCSFPYFPFWNYGCWCGKGAHYPNEHYYVDGFDKACMVHDRCWESLWKEDGPCKKRWQRGKKWWGLGWTKRAYLYVKSFAWDSSFDAQSKEFTISCKDEEDQCKRGYCECDKAVVLELARLSVEKGCRRYRNPGCKKPKP